MLWFVCSLLIVHKFSSNQNIGRPLKQISISNKFWPSAKFIIPTVDLTKLPEITILKMNVIQKCWKWNTLFTCNILAGLNWKQYKQLLFSSVILHNNLNIMYTNQYSFKRMQAQEGSVQMSFIQISGLHSRICSIRFDAWVEVKLKFLSFIF